MRVAVVTPYFKEPDDYLQKCISSVRDQTLECTHILVADGHPRDNLRDRIQHIRLPLAHSDGGATPRTIGALSAITQGFDAIAFLDADNWFYPNHIEHMVRVHRQTGAVVCTAARNFHRLDGSMMQKDTHTDGHNYVDANCYFFTRRSFGIMHLWAIKPRQIALLTDAFMPKIFQAHRLKHVHSEEPTVAYRTDYADHYRRAGEAPPPNAYDKSELRAAQKWWADLDAKTRESWMRYMLDGKLFGDDPAADLFGGSSA